MLLGLLLLSLCGVGEWQVNTDLFDEIPSYVNTPAVGPDGHIYFTDPREGRVYHLDETGALVAVFGSIGEGPGEFGRPYQLFVSHLDNLIFIRDFRRSNMMIFKPNGEFVSEGVQVVARTYPNLLNGGNTVFLQYEDPFVSPNQGAKVMVNLVDGGSRMVASFDANQHEDMKTAVNGGARGQMYFSWLRRVLFCVSPDQKTFYVGPNEQLDVVVYDAVTLKPIGTIEDDCLVKLPLTKEEQEGTRSGVVLNGKEYYASDFDQPDYKPAILELMAGAGGRLWVQLQRNYLAEQQKYRIYEKDGRFAGTLGVPKEDRIFYTDDHFIWFTSMNEAGDTLIAKKAYRLAP